LDRIILGGGDYGRSLSAFRKGRGLARRGVPEDRGRDQQDGRQGQRHHDGGRFRFRHDFAVSFLGI
jgi:hypothetical protein